MENSVNFTKQFLGKILTEFSTNYFPLNKISQFNQFFQILQKTKFRNKFIKHVIPQNTQLLWQNEKNQSIFLLIGGSGEVQIFRDEIIHGQLKRIKKAIISLPNIVGEMSLVTNGFSSAHVIVKEGDIFALEININHFHKIILELGFQEKLISIIQHRSIHNIMRIEYLSAKEVPQKIEEIAKFTTNLSQDILQNLITFAKNNILKEEIFYIQHCPKNTYVIEQFNPDKSFLDDFNLYFIINGKVGIYKFSPTGEPVFLGSLTTGSLIGEMIFFDELHRRSANVIALAESSLIGIKGKNFFRFLKEHPKLYSNLIEIIEKRKRTPGKKIKITNKINDFSNYFTSQTLENINAIQKVVAHFNQHKIVRRSDLAWHIIANSQFGVVTFDSKGKMIFIEISRFNAREMLSQFIIEESLDGKSRYELRSECIYRDPEIDSTRAYIKGTCAVRNIIDTLENRIYHKKELHKSTQWVKKRLQLHRELINEWQGKIIEGNAALKNFKIKTSPNILILLSGNTGVGKSFVANNISNICKRFNCFPIKSIVNTDHFKYKLRMQEGYQKNGSLRVNTDQVHFEGAELSEKIIEWSIDNTYSFILDKRFLKIDEITEILDRIKNKKYYVILIDIDSDLEISLDRVFGNIEKGIFGRDPDSVESIPPRSIIEEGYYLSVNQRIFKYKHSEIDEYYLFKNDSNNNLPILIAERISRKSLLRILPGHNTTFNYITRDTQYDKFVSICLENILKMSRSTQGYIDTSSTPTKDSSINKHDPESIKKITFRNIRGVLTWIFQNRNITFNNIKELRMFIEKAARDVNEGLLKSNSSLYRNANSTKYAYTPIVQLAEAANNFYEELHIRLQKNVIDPVELAAWIEYRVDLCDHFFQDGCGRTSKILSAWVLVKAFGKEAIFPIYHGREEYYANSPQTVNEEIRLKIYPKWLEYYRKLFK